MVVLVGFLVFEVPGWVGSGVLEVGSGVEVGGTGTSEVVGTVEGMLEVVGTVGVGGGVVGTPGVEVSVGGWAMIVGDWY